MRELEKLREMERAATGGPVTVKECSCGCGHTDLLGGTGLDIGRMLTPEDAEHYATMRNCFPALLDFVETSAAAHNVSEATGGQVRLGGTIASLEQALREAMGGEDAE